MCSRPEGAAVAAGAGVLAQAADALAGARGRPLRVAVLVLLRDLASHHAPSRFALRDRLDALHQLVRAAWPPRPATPQTVTSFGPPPSAAAAAAAAVSGVSAEPHVEFEFDVFLSHDWGKDELGRDNHERVAHINAQLQVQGVRTWFDAEQMRGAINNRMAEGIAGSSVILCFLTQNYIIKASGLGPRGEDDNCFFEFDNALIERGRSRLLPVVMEPRCCQTAKWTAGAYALRTLAHALSLPIQRRFAGVVKGKLGSKLYVNLADEVGSEGFTNGVQRLVQEVATLVGRELTPLATGVQQAEATSLPNDRRAEVAAPAEAVGTYDTELPVARAALELLLVLSAEEPLRIALQAAAPLELLETLIERSPSDRPSALLLLACVHAPRLDLKEGHNPADECAYAGIAERVIALLDRFAVEKEVLRNLSEALRNSRQGCGHLPSLRRNLAAVRGLASSSSRAARLVDAGAPSKLRQLLFEGPQGTEPATASDLATAADALCHCAYSCELRQELKAADIEGALQAVLACLPADDDSEGAGRLRQATKQALTALAGELDVTPSQKELGVRKRLSVTATDWSDAQLLEIPCFTAFVSHKRASAQDFARSLHSIVVGAGFSCFLDVVRACMRAAVDLRRVLRHSA